MITVAIRETAEKRGITTAYQLQKVLNVGPSMASKWWSNELQMIGITTLDKLCNALNATPSELLRFVPDDEKNVNK
jgi:DNA-binding Xre family transcriptional regulator